MLRAYAHAQNTQVYNYLENSEELEDVLGHDVGALAHRRRHRNLVGELDLLCVHGALFVEFPQRMLAHRLAVD